jgi:tetratricopeptide (TPR) repeat protein
MGNYYKSKGWSETRLYFVSKIKDLSIDLRDFIDEYLLWMESPKGHKKGANKKGAGRFDAYAIIYRNVLRIDKNGLGADPSTWGLLFDRIKDLHEMVMKDGSIFAKIMTCENLAHRYLDLYLKYKKEEDYERFEKLYKTAYDLSVKGEYWKNVDSSYYWLGIAYIRCEEPIKAIKCFCKVAGNKNPQYRMSTAFWKKVKYAKTCCKRQEILPCKESFQDPPLDEVNETPHEIETLES